MRGVLWSAKGRRGEEGRITYGVAGDGGDDGFADGRDLSPVLEEFVLVDVRVYIYVSHIMNTRE